jgi:hypothetical protein
MMPAVRHSRLPAKIPQNNTADIGPATIASRLLSLAAISESFDFTLV